MGKMAAKLLHILHFFYLTDTTWLSFKLKSHAVVMSMMYCLRGLFFGTGFIFVRAVVFSLVMKAGEDKETLWAKPFRNYPSTFIRRPKIPSRT